MTALYVPFTLAHGPTSINEEHLVLGADMHRWGMFLGVVPNVLIAAGLWRLREAIAGERRAARVAVNVLVVVLALSALGDLAFRALGPPIAMFVVVPALWVLVSTTTAGRPRRPLLAVLAVVQTVALVMGLIPLEIQDDFGGYRIFGSLAYGVTGLLWAVLGLSLARGTDRGRG